MTQETSRRPMPIRLLIAEDHAVVREGMIFLVTTRFDKEIVGEAEDGVEAIQAIKQKHPQAKILVMNSFAEEEKVLAAIRAGAPVIFSGTRLLEIFSRLSTTHTTARAPYIPRSCVRSSRR